MRLFTTRVLSREAAMILATVFPGLALAMLPDSAPCWLRSAGIALFSLGTGWAVWQWVLANREAKRTEAIRTALWRFNHTLAVMCERYIPGGPPQPSIEAEPKFNECAQFIGSHFGREEERRFRRASIEAGYIRHKVEDSGAGAFLAFLDHLIERLVRGEIHPLPPKEAPNGQAHHG